MLEVWTEYSHVGLGEPRRDLRKGNTMIRHHDFSELRLATLEVESGHYLDLTALMALIPDPNRSNLWAIVRSNQERFLKAAGSSHNHQAWEHGYLDHIAEAMNIACQQYVWMRRARRLPFELHEALEVMFLHDLEKPFKYTDDPNPLLKTKDGRKLFRNQM